MALTGKVPLASMGIDAPLACLSTKTRSFFDYFYQLFAQVTNPPIDALREHVVTSTILYLGNHGNLLEDSRSACQLIRLDSPILTGEQFKAISSIDRTGFHARTFRAVYLRDAGEGALERALDELCREVERAVRDGVNIVAISDRAGSGEVSIPSLLAVGAVHNHLMRSGLRTFADLIVECGDALSAHDLAALVSYSASGIYPYGAHAHIARLAHEGDLVEADGRVLCAREGIERFDRAATAGVVSIMSKMGISTMQSYHSCLLYTSDAADDLTRILPRPTSSPRSASPSGAPWAAKTTSSTPKPSTCCNVPCTKTTPRHSKRIAPACTARAASCACAT